MTDAADAAAITVEDAERVLRAEYWTEVRDLTASIIEEARDKWNDDTRGEVLREWLLERVHEDVDGHAWVIYTWKAHKVLLFSDNDAYSIENFGVESVVTDGDINWSALAYGALYADVMEQLDAELNGGVNDADEWFTSDEEE